MIAITPGEPAGIGPDLLVQLAQQSRAQGWVALCDARMLAARAQQLDLPLSIDDCLHNPSTAAATITVQHIPLAVATTAGRLHPDNAPGVLAALDAATAGCLQGTFQALVTGPVQKSVINEAGIPFSGHTEYLARASQVPDVVMLLVAEELRVALATTHLPLREVPDAINAALLERRLRILRAELIKQFGLPDPHILVAGLNPHAGEAGHLGREEIEVIEPVCATLRGEGFNLSGPLPADTLFTPTQLANADAVLAMYHDQGLPVLKHAGFGAAVNVTLGLPFVRTSVDHGTALDLAGSGQADPGSLRAALQLAARLSAG
ncbi:MAG: 4-hydroxythreonine-4-phosphate dehydrogenase PdxA [Pseudomonadota bacterium]